VFVPRARVIGGFFTAPPDGLTGFLTANPFPEKGWPQSYDLVAADVGFEAYTARVSEITRNLDQQVLSFRADAENPDGTGHSLFSAIAPDPNGIAMSYTETRVLDTTEGEEVHVFVVTDIEPLNLSGKPVSYDVEHTAPDGTKTTYLYPTWRLPD
jgi:hypothetical protein